MCTWVVVRSVKERRLKFSVILKDPDLAGAPLLLLDTLGGLGATGLRVRTRLSPYHYPYASTSLSQSVPLLTAPLILASAPAWGRCLQQRVPTGALSSAAPVRLACAPFCALACDPWHPLACFLRALPCALSRAVAGVSLHDRTPLPPDPRLAALRDKAAFLELSEELLGTLPAVALPARRRSSRKLVAVLYQLGPFT